MSNNKGRLLGPLFCISAALIWGLSFVFQSEGSGIVETFTFNGIRTFLGGIVLIPIVAFSFLKKNKGLSKEERQKFPIKEVFIGGLCCGIPLFIGGNLQQEAFRYLDAGKVGFITALYMLLVPIFGLFLKQRAKLNVWVGIGFGVFGLFLLSVKKGDFSLGKGEIITILCAVGFAAQIIAIDRFCRRVDCVALSCMQFLIAGVLSIICMFIFETPNITAIKGAGVQILYTGIMSCSCAFTFQVIGQKYSEPASSSILLCLESVFSVIFGWIILNQALNARELTGCAIMFVGIILTQLPAEIFTKKKKC